MEIYWGHKLDHIPYHAFPNLSQCDTTAREPPLLWMDDYRTFLFIFIYHLMLCL